MSPYPFPTTITTTPLIYGQDCISIIGKITAFKKLSLEKRSKKFSHQEGLSVSNNQREVLRLQDIT